jgi:hypothetical protein
MLAADDILVSLAGNRVVLTLDPAGAEITNLGTSYNAASGVLTITAAIKGTISTAAPRRTSGFLRWSKMPGCGRFSCNPSTSRPKVARAGG